MNKWLQIDAEQNEEWLRKQGTGTYIDLSTIKKGDLPGQVILEKHNGYKEVLNKAAMDKSKEIAAEGIVSWSAANWMESEYPYLTRKGIFRMKLYGNPYLADEENKIRGIENKRWDRTLGAKFRHC